MRFFLSSTFFATYFLLVLPLCMHSQQRIRQADPVELSIEEIGVAQGLSQGMVHGLEVDQKGYLWIATKDGLNRYDGNHFHVFRHDPQDTQSIASNYIRSLHIDARGLIWIGTNASGLDLYSPAKAGFIHFGNSFNLTSASSFQSISSIFSDPSGKILIWDGIGEQCVILVPIPGKDPDDVDAWEIKSLEEVYKIPSGVPRPTQLEMIGFGADGVLLYAHHQKLYQLYPDKVETWSPDKLDEYNAADASDNVHSIHYFLDDRRRLICMSIRERVVYRWDEHNDSFQKWIRLPTNYSLSSTFFFVDHLDRIWHNAATSPLYRINPHQATFQLMDVIRYHAAGMASTAFTIQCEDQHHNIWASTGGNGVIKISSRNDQFTRLTDKALDNLGVRIVRNGFSFNIHDQFRIDQEKVLQKRIAAEELKPISPYVEDDKQQLWCIAINEKKQEYYLIRINPEDLSFSFQPIRLCRQIMYENTASIMIDRHGDKWMGAECIEGEARLIHIHQPSGAQDSFTFPVQVIRNEHAFITDWYVDDQNVFWIGTKQGLFVFNPSTAKWKHYHIDPTRSNALSNNHILSICPDPKEPDKYLWIGTDGGGLNKMDLNTESFHHFSTFNGLPNNVIYAVQSDQHDKLWLSTNLGLCRFDSENEEVWSFTVDDGLPGNEFNRMEYGKGTDDRLYFGGIEGHVIFDPEVFYTSADSSPIVINRLKLSNKEVSYLSVNGKDMENDYHLPAPMEFCKQLTFPYTERMITLGFSLLDFTSPNGNKYRYKLEGFNNEWIDAGETNEAVFTNLSPGSYTFIVLGRNSNNVWSEPAKLQLIILSPWWATWWFRSLVVVMIASAIYAFYRYRLQQAMKLQHVRNRIAADLHDEIGSTLSSISLAGTVIQHKLKGHHPEVDGFLQKIHHNTQAMMEAMSDIVWAVNTKNDRFEQVLHRMRAFAGEILEPNDVLVHFESSPNVIQLQLDMQQRKNLYLIFKEVIHNAAKYAQCRNVWVTLSYTHGRLMMEIRDDGVGFDVQFLKMKVTSGNENEQPGSSMGGNGIQNMNQRAQELSGKLEVNSSPGLGTSVRLTFSV